MKIENMNSVALFYRCILIDECSFLIMLYILLQSRTSVTLLKEAFMAPSITLLWENLTVPFYTLFYLPIDNSLILGSIILVFYMSLSISLW